ncbi:UNVERIFIED_ORG: hypothetical protein M2348_001712 [Sphingomonas sp. R1F5B]
MSVTSPAVIVEHSFHEMMYPQPHFSAIGANAEQSINKLSLPAYELRGLNGRYESGIIGPSISVPAAITALPAS